MGILNKLSKFINTVLTFLRRKHKKGILKEIKNPKHLDGDIF
jgi:hypothetical protein